MDCVSVRRTGISQNVSDLRHEYSQSFDANLGNEHQTQRGRRAEDDEQGYQNENGVFAIGQNQRDRGTHDAHDHTVVYGHSDVLGVVQCRDRYVSGFPGQEGTEDQQQSLVGVDHTDEDGHPAGLAVLVLLNDYDIFQGGVFLQVVFNEDPVFES